MNHEIERLVDAAERWHGSIHERHVVGDALTRRQLSPGVLDRGDGAVASGRSAPALHVDRTESRASAVLSAARTLIDITRGVSAAA